jgi:DNA-binding IscR family transcriptional regulator
MKLQKATLFALFAVLELARDPSRQVSLVEAARGAGGGYRFAGNAKRTSLYDVVALFGDIVPDAGEIPGPAGETAVGTALAAVLREIDEIAIATFKSISLATLLKALERGSDTRAVAAE